MSDRFFWTRPSRVIGPDPRIALVPIRELMTWLRNRPAPLSEPAPPVPQVELPGALSRMPVSVPEIPEPTRPPAPVLPSAFDPRRAPAPRSLFVPTPAPLPTPPPTLPPPLPTAEAPPQPGLWQLTNRFTLPERRKTLRRPTYSVGPNAPPLTPILPPAATERTTQSRQPVVPPGSPVTSRLPPATQAPEPVPIVLPPVQAPPVPQPMAAAPPQTVRAPTPFAPPTARPAEPPPLVLPPVQAPAPQAAPRPITIPPPPAMRVPTPVAPPAAQVVGPRPVVLPPVQAPQTDPQPIPTPPPAVRAPAPVAPPSPQTAEPRPVVPPPVAAPTAPPPQAPVPPTARPIPESMRVPTPVMLPPVQAPVSVPMPARPPRPAPVPASAPETAPVSAARSAHPTPITPPELLQPPSHPIQPPRLPTPAAPPPPPPPPEQPLPSGPIDISQPAVFAPLPEGSGPKEPSRRIVPPPEYGDDLMDEYDELFEPLPDQAAASRAGQSPPADHESLIDTDWSRLRRVTNGELADEEWMGGPVPTASRPEPQRSDWQRVAMFAGAVLGIVAAGAGMVVLLWPQPAPARLAGVVTGSAISVFAPTEGRLSRVLVSPGAHVMRGAPLFEISGRGPDPAVRNDLNGRLTASRAHAERLTARMKELDSLLAANKAAPSSPTAQRDAELMRQRQQDLRDEQRNNDAETAQLERGLAALAEPLPIRTVAAEQEAVIRRLPVAAGQDVVPGLALGELVNCDTLFVTADGSGAAALGLVSGRTLHIRIEGSPTPIEAQVPGVALRKGAAAADDRSAALAVSGQLLVPVDKAAVERAASQSCPIGRHAVIEAD